MPMYTFACRTCEQPFEKKLRMSQLRDLQACPECGSDDTRRRISSAFALGKSSRAAALPARPANSPFT